jgi:glutamyl-Q tRNA(Asp) synthetase
VRSNTAIGTTATADHKAPCRGRFAPSPTGLLHRGSLLAALASFLDARVHGGAWLIRMEDLDTPRNVPGAADTILQTLAHLGLGSDEPVLWQSARREHYRTALQQLADSGHAYRCNCSRSDEPGVYSGRCRDRNVNDPQAAWRFRMTADVAFEDLIQGRQRFAPDRIGDPVIFRRDGTPAYQLAVVVDDAAQQITHVMRGADLLDSTAWQLAIGQALGLPAPAYAHVPLLLEADGGKLAKSRRSLPLDTLRPGPALFEALQLLRQEPPSGLQAAPVSEILAWAIAAWRPERLTGQLTIRLPP